MTTKNSEEILESLLLNQSLGELTQYICDHSNLPGPRANLELVSALYSVVGRNKQTITCDDLMTLAELDSVDNQPVTLVVGAALVALTHYLSTNYHQVEQRLYEAMSDHRWRIRELITEAYKMIALVDYRQVMDLFDAADIRNGMQYRAVIATLAHPEILKDEVQKTYALRWCEKALAYYLSQADYASEDSVVLEKGLSFTLSVVTAASSNEGFALIDKYIHKHKKIDRILKENLKKNRLARPFAEQVQICLEKLNDN